MRRPTTLGSYDRVLRDYYQQLAPGTPFEPGSPGWSHAPVPSWGGNSNGAGPTMLATSGLGAAISTRCNCEQRPVNGKMQTVCDCAPPPAPPAPPPFYASAPHWFFRQYVRSEVAPWGDPPGPAHDVPRRQTCPTCYGVREPTSGLGGDWEAIPYWCWTHPDGTANKEFVTCKDQAIRDGMSRLCGGLTGTVKTQCEQGVTSHQRLQWQMNACSHLCKKPASSTVPSATPPTSPPTSRSWRDLMPTISPTTIIIVALVGAAGVVVAQRKGWL